MQGQKQRFAAFRCAELSRIFGLHAFESGQEFESLATVQMNRADKAGEVPRPAFGGRGTESPRWQSQAIGTIRVRSQLVCHSSCGPLESFTTGVASNAPDENCK